LRDKIVKANFVQFDNDFTGLGNEGGMLSQSTIKSFCYGVYAQAWVKRLHVYCGNARH